MVFSRLAQHDSERTPLCARSQHPLTLRSQVRRWRIEPRTPVSPSQHDAEKFPSAEAKAGGTLPTGLPDVDGAEGGLGRAALTELATSSGAGALSIQAILMTLHREPTAQQPAAASSVWRKRRF